MVTKADADTENNLGTNITGLGGVDIEGIQEGGSYGGENTTCKFVGLEEACLSNEEPTQHRASSEEGHEGKTVDSTRDGGLAVDGLEVYRKVEKHLEIGKIRTVHISK